MSFYSKITLLALLATGIISACEHPGYEPLETARKEVQQAAEFILFTHEGTVLARVPKKCMAANPEFMSLCSEFQSSTEHQKRQKELFGDKVTTVELAGDVLEAFNIVKDYIVLDYELGLNLTIDNQPDILIVKEALDKKSEQELIAIITASQLCSLNHLSKYTVSLLAAKLNKPTRQKECLRNGSYNLQWSSDVARLVAQEMCRQKPCKTALLAEAQIRKYGSLQCIANIRCNENIADICFSPDSTLLAIGCVDNSVQIWNTQTWQKIGEIHLNQIILGQEGTFSLCFNPDSTILAVGMNGCVCLLDTTKDFEGNINWIKYNNEAIPQLRSSAFSFPIQAIGFNMTGSILIAGNANCKMEFWDIATKKQIGEPIDSMGNISRIINVDNTKCITIDGQYNRRLWDITTRQIIQQLSSLPRRSLSHCIRFNQDFSLSASIPAAGDLLIWNYRKNDIEMVYKIPKHTIESVHFSYDKSIIILNEYHDETLLNAQTGKFLNTDHKYTSIFGWTCINPQDNLLVTLQGNLRIPERKNIKILRLADANATAYLNRNLIPEQATLILYHFECEKNNEQYNHARYPGIEKIRKTFPQNFQDILQNGLQDQISNVSNTTKVAVGLGIAGLAAYCAYKWYYGKE